MFSLAQAPAGGGLESILILLPLIVCCLLMSIMRGGAGRQAPAETALETDVWFMPQKIEEAYKIIEDKTRGWVEEKPAETKPSRFALRQPVPSGFRAVESMPPRLYKLYSAREGEVAFEFTEVEGDGTSVKASYHPAARSRVQSLRAQLPLKVPSSVGKPCPYCGNPVLPDHTYCPFCGHSLKTG